MNCDALIEKYGRSLSILRTATVSTHGYLSDNTSMDVQSRAMFADLVVKYGSGLLAGEVIQDGSDYYLVAYVTDVGQRTGDGYKKALLLKCNATVTIQKLSSGAFVNVATGVHCVISKTMMSLPNDESRYRDRARGSQRINYVYLSSDEDLEGGYYIIDGSRTLKALDDISPYLTGGIIEAQAILE